MQKLQEIITAYWRLSKITALTSVGAAFSLFIHIFMIEWYQFDRIELIQPFTKFSMESLKMKACKKKLFTVLLCNEIR